MAPVIRRFAAKIRKNQPGSLYLKAWQSDGFRRQANTIDSYQLCGKVTLRDHVRRKRDIYSNYLAVTTQPLWTVLAQLLRMKDEILAWNQRLAYPQRL